MVLKKERVVYTIAGLSRGYWESIRHQETDLDPKEKRYDIANYLSPPFKY